MRNTKQLDDIGRNVIDPSLEDLRCQWQEAWGIKPHMKIGRTMLIKSLEYKFQDSQSTISSEQRERLKKLIALYKRNPHCFDENIHGLKPGTRLVKLWKEKRYSVLVVPHGFDYQDKIYTSLSEIAFTITGSRWNGWVFFGLKKHKRHPQVQNASTN